MGGGEEAVQVILAAVQPLTAMTEDRVMFSGFLSSGNYTAIVVAAPILDSQGNGPMAGTTIWFKMIDGRYLQEIESKTHVRVQIRPIDEATLAGYTQASNDTYYTRITDRDIEYLKLVSDIYDDAYIGIEIASPRDIRTQSQLSINSFMTAFVVVVVVFVGIIIVLIDRSLISRLISIGDQLRGVDLSKEKLGRISSPGGDEMTQLADEVNGLLKEIERYQVTLKEKERLAAIGETSAMVGHDLRSPLQVITSTLYLLRKRLSTALATATPEERRVIEEQLDNLDKQTMYMEKIVSDLRDISREIKPIREEVGIKTLFEDSLKMVSVPENVEVKWAIPDDSPKLSVDRGLMSRVFVNLINNAVGAMPNGGTLTLSAAASVDAIKLGVWDTGQGIDEELKARLFMPFESGRKGGLGLGLAICKRIVEAHGGSIDASSEVGKGTLFTVKLPRG
jgi:signal transduction histidine kinase